jgi:hypothetical protein
MTTTPTSTPRGTRSRPAALPPCAFDLLGGTGRQRYATRRLNRRLGATVAALAVLAGTAAAATTSAATAADNQAQALQDHAVVLQADLGGTDVPVAAADARSALRDQALDAATSRDHSQILADLAGLTATVGGRIDAITIDDASDNLQITGLTPDLAGIGQVTSAILASYGPAADGWASSVDVAYSPAGDRQRFTITVGLTAADDTAACKQLAAFADPTWTTCTPPPSDASSDADATSSGGDPTSGPAAPEDDA